MRNSKSLLKMITLSMLIALGVVISPILRVEGMCPMAHFINIVCSVFLGPWYSLLCATLIGVIRMMLMGIPPIALTGAANLELSWLRPTALTWEPMLALALLMPVLPAAGGGRGRNLLCVGILAFLLAALAQGVLSPVVASALSDPEYQTARTLGHLEPVAAAALTLGWYAMATWLFSAAAEIARLGQMKEKLSCVLMWEMAATMVAFEWQLSAPFFNSSTAL